MELPIHWELYDLPYFTFTFDPPIPPGQARAANMEQVLENWMTELEGARRFGTLLNLQLDPQASGEQGRIFMLERLLAAMQDAGDVWIATGRDQSMIIQQLADRHRPRDRRLLPAASEKRIERKEAK